MLRIWIAMNLAMAYAKAGRSTEAVELFEESLPQFDPMGIEYGRLMALPLLADVYFMNCDVEAALKTASTAMQHQDDKRTRLQRPHTLDLLGRIYSGPQYYDPKKAQTLFQDGLLAAEQQGSRTLLAHCHAGLGRLHHIMGNPAIAKEKLTCACDMYREMDMTFYLDRAQEDLAKLS